MMSLRFRLFGFPVELQFGALLLAGLIGFSFDPAPRRALLGGALILLSILVHELGHAFTARRFGFLPKIRLHTFGGLTSWVVTHDPGRWRTVGITLAGPGAGFALACVAALGQALLPAGSDGDLSWALRVLTLINLIWTAINLLPVLPFDGGQVMLAVLGPKRAKLGATLSLVFGLVAAAAFAQRGWWMAAVMFGMGGVSSYLAISRQVQLRPTEEQLEALLLRARRALDAGELRESFALARLATGFETPLPARARAVELASWAALQGEEPSAARALIEQLPKEARVDPYLLGALLDAEGRPHEAAAVLRRARTAGDLRPALTGLLIKVLLAAEQGPEAVQLTMTLAPGLAREDLERIRDEGQRLGADVSALQRWLNQPA